MKKYKISEFMDIVDDFISVEGSSNAAGMLYILTHAMQIMPWVHVDKEWEITISHDIMILGGVLAPHIQVFLCLTGNQSLQVILSTIDEIEDSKKTLYNKTILSIEAPDIIGCVSQMLGVYIHEVSSGVRKFFRQYSITRHHGLGVDNMLLSGDNDEDSEYHFRPSNDVILSPTELTFFDLETQQWVHPKDKNIEYVKEHNILALNEDNLGWATLPEFERLYPVDKEKRLEL